MRIFSWLDSIVIKFYIVQRGRRKIYFKERTDESNETAFSFILNA